MRICFYNYYYYYYYYYYYCYYCYYYYYYLLTLRICFWKELAISTGSPLTHLAPRVTLS